MQRIGPYSVLEEIARGGQGVVYRAQDAQGRVVALKLLLAHRAESELAHKRFQAEIAALTRLRHPHVVSILAAGEHEGGPWLALDYVEGESLEERLRHGPLPVDDALRVAQQLAEALRYAHSCGVLHRDLKPDNVLLRGCDALLTDFGLALDTEASISRITAPGTFQGTPGYWSPEQARGQTELHGPLTDVYGLGAVLYACLTGSPPVQASNLQEFMQSLRFKAVPSPRRVRPEVPDWLSALCMRCLAVLPSARPRSAEEVLEALYAEARPTKQRPHRATRVLAALTAVGACAAVGLAVWVAQGHPKPAQAPAPPVAQAETKAQNHLEQAIRAWDEDRYDDVVAHCDLALGLDPELGLAWSYRGASHRVLDRPEQALADLNQAVSLIPQHAPAYDHRGGVELTLGQHEAAIRDYSTAIALEPTTIRFYTNRARARALVGRYALAKEDYDAALALNPLSAVVHSEMGATNFEAGRFEEAIKNYSASLELDPQNAVTYAKRGRSRIELGDVPRSLADLRRAIELNPDLVIAHLNRGSILQRAERHAEAITCFDRAVELGVSEALVYAHRGVSKAQLGRYVEAIEDYDRAIELDPDWATRNQIQQGRAIAASKLRGR